MTIFTLDSDPMAHAITALAAAGAVARQGRDSWPRSCELARRALAGFSKPSGMSLAEPIAETKKFLAQHACGGQG
jgi:hypothetical protein